MTKEEKIIEQLKHDFLEFSNREFDPFFIEFLDENTFYYFDTDETYKLENGKIIRMYSDSFFKMILKNI